MLMGSPTKKRGQSFLSFLGKDAEDLMTHKEWVAKSRVLREQNKIFDPSNQIIKRAEASKDKWEPPTLDSAPPEWHDKIERKLRKSRRKDTLEFMVSGG